MLADVNRRDLTMWRANSAAMSKALREELLTAPTGTTMRSMLHEQVDLITSLPKEAAERVHEMAQKTLVTGQRSKTLIKDILETGDVTEARARCIARTEVSRAAAKLTQARAEYAGSEGYIWRTVHDMDVRPSHKEMDGKYVRWSQEPLLSDGTRTHAGCIYNCRCVAEPILAGESIPKN